MGTSSGEAPKKWNSNRAVLLLVLASLLCGLAWLFGPLFGLFQPTHRMDAIAVGGGYSINLRATPMHPWLAEYEQKLVIYSGDRNTGQRLGTVDIAENTGGRIRIGVFALKSPTADELVLLQRSIVTIIDLDKLSREFVSHRNARVQSILDPDLVMLGWISGQAYPVKFIPCSAWPLMPTNDRYEIIGGEPEWDALCEEYSP